MSRVTPRLKKRRTSRSAKHYNGQSGRNVPFNSMTVRVNNDNDGKILGGAGGGGVFLINTVPLHWLSLAFPYCSH